MARNNNAPILIGLVLFGVLALGGTILLLGGRGRRPAPGLAEGPAVPTPVPAKVYVARTDIPSRTRITRIMFEETSAPLTPGAITSADLIEGQLASGDILKGQTLTRSLVTPAVARVIPANIPVPPTLRAVAVWLDPNQTAGGLVDAGDHVDVVAVYKMTVQGKAPITGGVATSRTIAQDRTVLAVDKSLSTPPPAPPAQQSAPGAPGAVATPPPAPTAAPTPGPSRTRVVLAVTPEEAERIVAANTSGEIHLTIRNGGDRGNYALPEASEYPVRLVNAAAQDRAERLRQEARQDRLRHEAEARQDRQSRSANRSVPPFPGRWLPPAPVTTTQVVPAAPAQKEVTVIRGTEKTRVLVSP